MAQPIMSYRKSLIISFLLFLGGLAILTLIKSWWPSIMLVIGIPLGLYQYLGGRRYDMFITLFVFIGVFITVQFNIVWEIVLPILFVLGGIYIFFKEFFRVREITEEEEEEEENKEIEEEEEEKKGK